MKGFAGWLASKISILLFAILIFSAFAYYLSVQTEFQQQDTVEKQAENLARTIDSISSSPYYMETNYTLAGITKLRITTGTETKLYLHTDKSTVKKTLHTNAQPTEILNPTDIRITKDNTVKVIQCP